MIRGTTPTLTFTLPFEVSVLSEAYITLCQNGNTVIEKCMSDCVCEGDTITVKLTQEETLKLECSHIVEIQIRAKTEAGDAIASNVIQERTERILKDGVI